MKDSGSHGHERSMTTIYVQCLSHGVLNVQYKVRRVGLVAGPLSHDADRGCKSLRGVDSLSIGSPSSNYGRPIVKGCQFVSYVRRGGTANSVYVLNFAFLGTNLSRRHHLLIPNDANCQSPSARGKQVYLAVGLAKLFCLQRRTFQGIGLLRSLVVPLRYVSVRRRHSKYVKVVYCVGDSLNRLPSRPNLRNAGRGLSLLYSFTNTLRVVRSPFCFNNEGVHVSGGSYFLARFFFRSLYFRTITMF